MTTIHDTAYPRLRSQVTLKELAEVYSPTHEELALASRSTKGSIARLGFLVLLKTFQRLGYFVFLREIPLPITRHIASSCGLPVKEAEMQDYDGSGTRRRHLQLIREYLSIKPYGQEARKVALKVIREAAQTKDEVPDLINVAIEELVRQRWELPAFEPLRRAARRVRVMANRELYQKITCRLSASLTERIGLLFETSIETRRSPWNELKRNPGSATLNHLRELIAHHQWLCSQSGGAREALSDIPVMKVKQFAAEAMSLDAARMQAVARPKQYALACALLATQHAQAVDDLAEMLIKRMTRIHNRGEEALRIYREQHQTQTDGLIGTLRDLIVAYQTEDSDSKRLRMMGTILGDRGQAILQQCEEHRAFAGNNYSSFLWRFYASNRATMFRLLKEVSIRSTSQDTSIVDALQFFLSLEKSRAEWVKLPALTLSWIPDTWWPIIFQAPHNPQKATHINRRHFEVCLLSQIMLELKSGDLYVEGSDKFADYRTQLVSWDEYERAVHSYGDQVALPIEEVAFVEHVQKWLTSTAEAADRAFPTNESVRLENGEPIISRAEARSESEQVRLLERLIAARIEPVNILDVLADTEQWLNWTRSFGPLSGHNSKLEDPRSRYLMTTFCYGCNLGPSQASRALENIDRRHLAWINQRHITEGKLDQVITELINSYNRFELPHCWGTGKHASADGTKWDVYEQNLLSEYHIRYGGYGGIGYYHVSDMYVALFSHFIPCGVWEAVYILDGLLKNQSEIQPDTIHADTQGQSAPVFGLAYLLGIKLMPRIRNWKHLKFFRPTAGTRYTHIDPLFSDTIDWNLIRVHLPDMLRVALSIRSGCISASTILRRLGTKSRKNRLYFAFRELGRAVRTGFLLNYLADTDLRATIQSATNKSESFNQFVKWLFFGGCGVIAENTREEQRKIIKYNHLVANCLILHNVYAMTRIIRELAEEGTSFDNDTLARLSPYLTQHINRFGAYTLRLDRNIPAPQYLLHAADTGRKVANLI